MSEISGLLKFLGTLHVIACDYAAAPAQKVFNVKSVNLIGGEGTDMGAGLQEAARALKPAPDVTIVLTDGVGRRCMADLHEASRAGGGL
jgi:predicted metal-dependent peptidase